MQNQKELIQNVLFHCAHFSPYYQEQRWAEKVRAGKRLRLRNIPITPRDTVRENTAHFYSDRAFPADGTVITKYTSGSTGEPMEVRSTSLYQSMNDEENKRLKQGWWDEKKISNRLILKLPSEENPFGSLKKDFQIRGLSEWNLYSLDAKTALETILKLKPEFLFAYPSLILEILKLASASRTELPLKFLYAVGETISDELCHEAEVVYGCKLYYAYGSVETGIIAGRCALCGDYHPAENHMVVEILRPNGSPVKPEETGKVVVTPLFNSAMPLIRYDIGDLATRSNNTCAISKMSISKIVGRTKNMFKLANGKTFTPMLPARDLAILGVIRYKLIQISLETVEFHYVPKHMEIDLTKEVIQPLIDTHLDPDYTVEIHKKEHLPRLPSGKYLMHESMLLHNDA